MLVLVWVLVLVLDWIVVIIVIVGIVGIVDPLSPVIYRPY